MATQGLDSVLDELDAGPSSLFDIFGICTDMVGCLMAIPDQEDLPGAEYRHWVRHNPNASFDNTVCIASRSVDRLTCLTNTD